MTLTPAPVPAARDVAYPEPPANIAPYVTALGAPLAVRFLLEFGGAQIYSGTNPGGRSRAEALVGAERLRLLWATLPPGASRVPLGNPWLIRALQAEGKSVAEIARTCRVSDWTVRNSLRQPAAWTST